MPKVKIADLDYTEKGPGSDMMLYFNHCIVRLAVNSTATPQWAKYNGYGPKGHMFTVAGAQVIVAASAPGAYIEWTYPRGWYNTQKSAVFCQRIPRRQYQKAFSAGNFRVTSAEDIAKDVGMFNTKDEKILSMIGCVHLEGKIGHQLSVDFVSKTFNPFVGFPSLEEAYVQMKSRKVFSRALSSILSLFPHPKTNDFIVFCNDMPVGELLTKNKFKLIVPEFKPECYDYFQKENVTVVS